MNRAQGTPWHTHLGAILFLFIACGTPLVFADEFTSTNYKLLDSVIAPSGFLPPLRVISS